MRIADKRRESYHAALPASKTDLAALAFLKLQKILRVTFLQDAVHWRQRYPLFFLWDHGILQTDAFKNFEVFALRLSRVHAVSMDQRIKDALPVLAEQLSGLLGQHEKSISSLGQRVDAGFNLGDDKSRRDITKNPSINSHNPLYTSSGHSSPVCAPRRCSCSRLNTHFLSNLNASCSAGRSADTLEDNRNATPGPSSSGPSSFISSAVDPPAPIIDQPRVSGPEQAFSLSRSVTTVVDLWTEYSVGLDGRPSVRFMYEQG